MSAPEGLKALAAVLVPDGYQPSVKYCWMSTQAPAVMGVAMEVPLSNASVHVAVPGDLHLQFFPLLVRRLRG